MKEYLRDAIQNLPQYNYKEQDNIYLMGRIGHILLVREILEEMGCRVFGILDNDEKKQGLSAEGLPISPPGDVLEKRDPDTVIFIYSPKYFDQMLRQCEAYGYIENRSIFVIGKPDLRRNTYLVQVGVKTCKRFQDIYGEDVRILYANCPLGDYYLLSLFLDQFCRKRKLKNYVIAGSARTKQKLSQLLSMVPAEELSVLESEGIAMAWKFLGAEEVPVFPLTIWQGYFRFNSCLIRQSERFSFTDTFRSMIFRLDEGAEPDFKDLTNRDFDVAAFASERGLERGRTVILNPFSYSLQPLPRENWVEIAALLREKGYIVAINAGWSGEQIEIPDTVRVELGFAEIMTLMEYAGCVIGMRSGFFDITCKAKCKRIVLYPKSTEKNYEWNSTGIDFCSLKAMGLCEDAYEFEVKDFTEVLKEIDHIMT